MTAVHAQGARIMQCIMRRSHKLENVATIGWSPTWRSICGLHCMHKLTPQQQFNGCNSLNNAVLYRTHTNTKAARVSQMYRGVPLAMPAPGAWQEYDTHAHVQQQHSK
jgi:hypothetical protein